MKYKLLKDLPWCTYSPWFVHEFDYYTPEKYPDFFEPIVEKKTYDDLKEGDTIFWIWKWSWDIYEWKLIDTDEPRSEVFLTREEAEDEHKRREWACRKDKFIPNEGEGYFTYTKKQWIRDLYNYNDIVDSLLINLWLAFRTREECGEAIASHDLIRLFYTIR